MMVVDLHCQMVAMPSWQERGGYLLVPFSVRRGLALCELYHVILIPRFSDFHHHLGNRG
jgi:hypothetical protein